MVARENAHTVPLDKHFQTDGALCLFLHPRRQVRPLRRGCVWRLEALLQVHLLLGDRAVCWYEVGGWLFLPTCAGPDP